MWTSCVIGARNEMRCTKKKRATERWVSFRGNSKQEGRKLLYIPHDQMPTCFKWVSIWRKGGERFISTCPSFTMEDISVDKSDRVTVLIMLYYQRLLHLYRSARPLSESKHMLIWT